MATTHSDRQQATLDEAILLRSFDNLERTLREKGNEKPAEWAEILGRCLGEIETALRNHERTLASSDSPAEQQEQQSNAPATIERRWDKLRACVQETIGRIQELRRRAECVSRGRAARNQGCEMVELEQEVAELVPAVRGLKARQQALLADHVMLEVGVGD